MSGSFILGAGVCTGLGRGLAENLEALTRRPPAPTIEQVQTRNGAFPTPCHRIRATPEDETAGRLRRTVTDVVAEALDAAKLTHAQRRDTVLVLGTSSLDIADSEALFEQELARNETAYPLSRTSLMGHLAESIRGEFDLGGPDYTLSTACTASANAVLVGDALLRSKRASHVVALGVEIFNLTTALGFNSLGLLATDGMKPFDSRRNGLVLGEGCAAVVLSSSQPRQGGFRILGGANICDTYGVSAANPDGSTVEAVMRGALTAARIRPDEVRAVKTHGTASLLNDEAEAAGILRLFPAPPPLCALKPFIGHTFGACGLNELVLFCAAAAEGFLPGTPGIAAEPGDLGVSLNQRPTPLQRGAYLLNYFGFGGNNTCLVVANHAA